MSKQHASSDHKPAKCVRDIRDFPPASYRLPDDGRKWLAVARQRRALGIQLATHADGDGSSITAGVTRWAKALGISKRTVYRLLDDLRKIGPGFLSEKEGLTKEHGTAIRRIDVSKLKMPEAEVSDSQSRSVRLEGFGGPGVTPIGGTQPCLNIPTEREEAGVPPASSSSAQPNTTPHALQPPVDHVPGCPASRGGVCDCVRGHASPSARSDPAKGRQSRNGRRSDVDPVMPASVREGLSCVQDEVKSWNGTRDKYDDPKVFPYMEMPNHLPAKWFPAFQTFVERDGGKEFASNVLMILLTAHREIEETEESDRPRKRRAMLNWGYLLNRYESEAETNKHAD